MIMVDEFRLEEGNKQLALQVALEGKALAEALQAKQDSKRFAALIQKIAIVQGSR